MSVFVFTRLSKIDSLCFIYQIKMNLEELYIQRNEYARQGDIKEAEEITRQIDDMLPSKEKNVLILTERYCPEKYPKYDNYDAINVDKVKDIPYDYDGVMGVPITFLSWYRPGAEILCPAEEQMNHQSYIKLFSVFSCLKDTQFEIIGHEHDLDGIGTSLGQFEVNGKGIYKRILIRILP